MEVFRSMQKAVFKEIGQISENYVLILDTQTLVFSNGKLLEEMDDNVIYACLLRIKFQ